jgi:hypothetical protein
VGLIKPLENSVLIFDFCTLRVGLINNNPLPAKFQRNLLQSTIFAGLRFYQHVPHHGIHQPALVKITSHSALACGRAICKLIHGA